MNITITFSSFKHAFWIRTSRATAFTETKRNLPLPFPRSEMNNKTSPSYYSESYVRLRVGRSWSVAVQVPKLSLKGKVYVTLLCEGAFEAYGG